MQEKLNTLSVAELRKIAKEQGLTKISALRKEQLIAALLPVYQKQQTAPAAAEKQEAEVPGSAPEPESGTTEPAPEPKSGTTEPAPKQKPKAARPASARKKKETTEAPAAEKSQGTSEASPTGKPQIISPYNSGEIVSGVLEVMADGFGFLRSDNYMSGDNDIYVSPQLIRRFNLKTGDGITGMKRIKSSTERYAAILYITDINGLSPNDVTRRRSFEAMTPIFPNEHIRLETENCPLSMRIVDLISPIGKGQRGMIVSPPKAGKTTLLKQIAKSILTNHPEMHLIVLLIDERPEEVTDIRESLQGDNVEVIYSTFDEMPEHHKRVSEMVLSRAKRMVECHRDVTILLDSITRLARAYNLLVPPSGRTLSGGLDPTALYAPKQFFGAARNIREGGSLTILATALIDTGSRMDDMVFEEFKGTGNMELVLDRGLSERRVFPAIDILKSGTRRDDLLLSKEAQDAMYFIRRYTSGAKPEDAIEKILEMFSHTKNNREFLVMVRKTLGINKYNR